MAVTLNFSTKIICSFYFSYISEFSVNKTTLRKINNLIVVKIEVSLSIEPRECCLHAVMDKLRTKHDECLCQSLYALDLPVNSNEKS